MSRLLLDTHVWIWAEQEPSRLGHALKRQLLSGKTTILISPISTLEIAQLVSKQRLELLRPLEEWVRKSIENLQAETTPFTHEIAISAYADAALHLDPADRILIATAYYLDATMVTQDERILGYEAVDALDCRE